MDTILADDFFLFLRRVYAQIFFLDILNLSLEPFLGVKVAVKGVIIVLAFENLALLDNR